MGQARNRGSYDQRVALALERNRQIEEGLKRRPAIDPIHALHRKSGTQRIATRLTAAGVLPVPTLAAKTPNTP